MRLFSFADKDPCPRYCTDIAAFKKSKTAEQVAEQKRDVKNTKPLAEHEIYKVAAEEEDGEQKADLMNAQPNREQRPLLQLQPSTGKFDWSLLASLTGTRPNVTKYSIHRYSPDEWTKHNARVLSDEKLVDANILEYNGQLVIGAAYSKVDKVQSNNINRLKHRAKEIFRWKIETELACKAMAAEVELLELIRRRVKDAIRVLMLPESISKECIELRSNRAETDLVMDTAEQELLKEMQMVSEGREMLRMTLQKIEEQLAVDKAAKHKIEYDWSDKTVAYKTEVLNLSLCFKSNTIMFKHGATKFSDHTTSPSYWEYYSRKNLEEVEAIRQTSADLRSTLNGILINNGRELRQQADKTDSALAETSAFTTALLTELEEHLRKTLQSLAEIELLILNLHYSIRRMDAAMKLAQTRLDNRNILRPHQENVRDTVHLGLLQEVKVIHEKVTSLHAQLNNAERNRRCLMEKRKDIEIDIASKKKTLNIDRERCGMIRSHYPTALELAGL